MAEADTQIVLREPAKPEDVVPFHKSRHEILSPFGIRDNGKPLSQLIKNYLIDVKGFKKGSEGLREAYYEVLRGNVAKVAAIKINDAIAKGWLPELRPGKLDKNGKEKRFSVTFFEPIPVKAKALTKAQEERIFDQVGGRDTVLGKQIAEQLKRANMLYVAPTVNAQATEVKDEAKAEAAPEAAPEAS